MYQVFGIIKEQNQCKNSLSRRSYILAEGDRQYTYVINKLTKGKIDAYYGESVRRARKGKLGVLGEWWGRWVQVIISNGVLRVRPS